MQHSAVEDMGKLGSRRKCVGFGHNRFYSAEATCNEAAFPNSHSGELLALGTFGVEGALANSTYSEFTS